MIIRSRAPLRLSFAGGGTDVEPYLSERGGAVLNATIDKCAYASLRLRDEPRITVTSLDYDILASYRLDQPLTYDGKLDLVKAVIRRLGGQTSDQGLDFFLHSDAPPGSGLGSSSSVVVALIGLFKHWLHLPLTCYEIAELAYDIERVDLGIKGGKQDQYAATFGGFNFIEFTRESTIVNQLLVSPDTLRELRYNLLLAYTGKTRRSAGIIDTQVQSYVTGRRDVIQAMDGLKRDAVALKSALLNGRLDDFGELLNDAWLNKKRIANQITNDFIDELYETARSCGAIGGKIVGAGGGGYLLLYCRFDKKHIVASEIERLGAKVVDFNFDFDGSKTWDAR